MKKIQLKIIFIPLTASLIFTFSHCEKNPEAPSEKRYPEDTYQYESYFKKIAGLSKSVHVIVTDTDRIFVGTEAGVYRLSRNEGQWTNLGLTDSYVTSLIVDSLDNIYAGNHLGEIYKYHISQPDWKMVYKDSLYNSIQSMAYHMNNGCIYAGTRRGEIYQSADDGETWDLVFQVRDWAPFEIFCLSINSNGTIFAGSELGIYRSDDDGENWVNLKEGFYMTDGYPPAWSVHFNSVDHVFIGTGFSIYRSTNNGDDWSIVEDNRTQSDLIVINSNDHIYNIDYEEIFYSTDNGDTWQTIEYKHVQFPYYCVDVDVNGYILLGAQNGIYNSIQSTAVEN